MPANLLTTAAGAADSGDLVVASGSSVTVALKGYTAGDVEVIVSLKDEANNYIPVDKITSAEPVIVITAPGTYRFSRKAGQTCGVFSA